ncbi:hypothetical protein [Bifidobacterium longum]|uniref:Uncharacterized protein n=1 Tax=Bifidobacterium longum subsp. suis TaxID=1695 RepID=A0A087BP75_BIFLN|nr:hypothetical protein [Bifidobacterium longum]KFI72825.1 hypothetical protein BLSS_3675 [Bifidobacterium longum subsp. suis]
MLVLVLVLVLVSGSVMPARLGRGKTARFGENGSRIVWNRLE